ncbi:site-2 protease family protein [Veillonella montpellierensis]|uniref:site-2 protease family protein n=1 Tax=Veillonella montpellierensis TaxID=187328 RepID=UPI000428B728|nr:site-2 protease family protein [Veillonella montpellierensis]
MFDINPIHIIASLPAIIIAMVFHEYAHARMADTLGDKTPYNMGRLTLNPMAHMDFLGLFMLIIARFGWAKPVPINPMNFKHPRRDDIIVSLAGSLANLLIAFIFTGLYILYNHWQPMSYGLQLVVSYIVLYNINFAIFNMIPLPPLDGSHIVANLLPDTMSSIYQKIAPFSFIILIVLLYTPILAIILIPLQRFFLTIFNGFFTLFLL